MQGVILKLFSSTKKKGSGMQYKSTGSRDIVYWDNPNDLRSSAFDYHDRRYRQHFVWEVLSRYQFIPEQFVHDFWDKVDWDDIALYQNVTGTFLTEHKVHVENE